MVHATSKDCSFGEASEVTAADIMTRDDHFHSKTAQTAKNRGAFRLPGCQDEPSKLCRALRVLDHASTRRAPVSDEPGKLGPCLLAVSL